MKIKIRSKSSDGETLLLHQKTRFLEHGLPELFLVQMSVGVLSEMSHIYIVHKRPCVGV